MLLAILHYHFRPGGVRRVIEKATPAIVAKTAGEKVDRVLLHSGEAIPQDWLQPLRKSLAPIPVEEIVWPSLGYAADHKDLGPESWKAIHTQLQSWTKSLGEEKLLLWTHNLSVGRNPSFARALGAMAAEHPAIQVWSCHDFWFDGRLQRWPEMQRAGATEPAIVSQWLFPEADRIRFACINQMDFRSLQAAVGWRAGYLPNLAERFEPVEPERKAAARSFLSKVTSSDGAPVWLLPCRVLRRKNIAEALLATRLINPEAWVAVTGQVSSPVEEIYAGKLRSAAQRHGWKLRLGVLGADNKDLPTIPELMAAADVVLLTSIQEGFGLPFLEAAAANRPLLCRIIPNVMPDLLQTGFQFPQAYDELLVPTELLNAAAETERQQKLWQTWRSLLPSKWSSMPETPKWLGERPPQITPFSRLSVEGQMEVLAHGDARLADACLNANPQFRRWRELAKNSMLAKTEWSFRAEDLLGASAYARRFWQLADPSRSHHPLDARHAVDDTMVRLKLSREWLFPLLW